MGRKRKREPDGDDEGECGGEGRRNEGNYNGGQEMGGVEGSDQDNEEKPVS